MQIHFVSFIGLAPGAEKLAKGFGQARDLVKRQQVLSESALQSGEVDHVHLSNRDQLLATDYYKQNKDLLDQPRGCGYWAWKPYIILQTLAKASPGDFVIYCDVGKPTTHATADHGNKITTSLKPLVEWADRHGGMLPGVYLSNHGPARNWIKRDCFLLMDCDSEQYHQMPTVQAGYTVWENTPEVIRFLEEWQSLNLDPRLISDQENTLGKENYAGFQRNCHDQATLTLLTEKLKVTVFGGRKNQFLGFRNINFIAHEAAYQNALFEDKLILKKVNAQQPILANYKIKWFELLFQYRRHEKLEMAIVGNLTTEQKQAWQSYIPNVMINELSIGQLQKKDKSYDLLIIESLGKEHFDEALLVNSFMSLRDNGVAYISPLPEVKSKFEIAARLVSNDGCFAQDLCEKTNSKIEEPKIPNSRNPIFVSGKSHSGNLETMCVMIKPVQ